MMEKALWICNEIKFIQSTSPSTSTGIVYDIDHKQVFYLFIFVTFLPPGSKSNI